MPRIVPCSTTMSIGSFSLFAALLLATLTVCGCCCSDEEWQNEPEDGEDLASDEDEKDDDDEVGKLLQRYAVTWLNVCTRRNPNRPSHPRPVATVSWRIPTSWCRRTVCYIALCA